MADNSYDPSDKFTWKAGDIEILNGGKGSGKPLLTPEQLAELRRSLSEDRPAVERRDRTKPFHVHIHRKERGG